MTRHAAPRCKAVRYMTACGAPGECPRGRPRKGKPSIARCEPSAYSYKRAPREPGTALYGVQCSPRSAMSEMQARRHGSLTSCVKHERTSLHDPRNSHSPTRHNAPPPDSSNPGRAAVGRPGWVPRDLVRVNAAGCKDHAVLRGRGALGERRGDAVRFGCRPAERGRERVDAAEHHLPTNRRPTRPALASDGRFRADDARPAAPACGPGLSGGRQEG